MRQRLGPWRHQATWKRFGTHWWRHFKEDRAFEEAASLGYTSLLALVPLLAVAFGAVSIFSGFDRWSGQLQTFIFNNFVPAAGEQVQEYVLSFMASAYRLTLPGAVFLILAALLLMVRIETALNRIWRVSTPRTVANRVVMYWAVLTLGPLALGAAAAISAQGMLNVFGGGQETASLLRGLGVFVLTWLAFTVMFVLVPNRPVKLRHATIGGLVAAVLFEVGKEAFAAWVSTASFNVIYGTLATVPIFLFWLYLAWLFVLLGASLAASLTTFQYNARQQEWPEPWLLLLAFRVMSHLWAAQKRGEGCSMERLLSLEEVATDTQIHRLMSQLERAGLVVVDRDSRWRCSRDLDSVTLGELYHAGDFHLPLDSNTELPTSGPCDPQFLEIMRELHDGASGNLDRSLKSLYERCGIDESGPVRSKK